MNRVEKVLEKLKVEGLDGILLVTDSNIRYLSGFTGSDSYIIISTKGNAFITDARYTEQAEEESRGFDIIRWKSPELGLPEAIQNVCEKYGIRKLGFEKDCVTFDLYEKLVKILTNVELVATTGLVQSVRRVKDQIEIECIRKAAQIADAAFAEILSRIKPGVSEKDIERELHYFIKKNGADDIAFPIIAVSGKRSSLPHAMPSDKLIENGDLVTLDFGATYKGYRSDMTRTIIVGHANEKQKEIYRIVKAAQEEGSKAVKAGVSGKAADDCARNFITAAGYGQHFGHGLGHGVGLDIHEEPTLSVNSIHVLEEGNVVTVEPGIYIPNWGGVRIEDTVVVTKDGIEILTKSPKELIEIVLVEEKSFVQTFALSDGRQLVIRNATKHDASAMHKHLNEASRESDNLSFGEGEFCKSVEDVANQIEGCITKDNAIYIIAEVDGRLAGQLSFEGGWRKRTYHVGEFGISIRKEFWGIGIGSILIQHLIDWAKESKIITKINLRANSSNAIAIKLYEKLGFKHEGKISKDMKINGIYIDTCCMGMEIAGQ